MLLDRRQELSHEDVGIRGRPPTKDGISQADVAELAAVSLNWYQLFESGRGDRRVSVDFLDRIAQALRLDDDDRLELFRLALPESEALDHLQQRAEEASIAVLQAMPRFLRAVLDAADFRRIATIAAETVQAGLKPTTATVLTVSEPSGNVAGTAFGAHSARITTAIHRAMWDMHGDLSSGEIAIVDKGSRELDHPAQVLQVQSSLTVALRSRERSSALLSAFWSSRRRFSRVELEMIRGIAGIVELVHGK